MLTECYYRNYETDDIYKIARSWISETMDWLCAN
jgi:hypothetical protein